MEEKNKFKEYLDLVDCKIPRSTEIHFVNLLKWLYDFSVNYNNYIESDKRIFEIRKDLGFNKRELEKLTFELKESQKGIDSNISSLIYNSDQKNDFDFNTWIEENEKNKNDVDKLENKISSIKTYIEDLTKEENRLIELRSDFKYNLTIITRMINKNKNKEIFFDSIHLNDLKKIETLLDNEKNVELLQKYFILTIGLKKIIFNNINILINDLTINNSIEDSTYIDIKIMMLSLIGMVDADKEDLNVIIYDPVFKDKLSLLEVIFNYLNTRELNNNTLEKFEHIKFLNEHNKWILELLDLLREKIKNSNKKK